MMLRLPLAIACLVLCASCGPTDQPATVTATAVDESATVKNAQRMASSAAHTAIPGDSVALMLERGRHAVSHEERIIEQQANDQKAIRTEGERMAKQAAEQIAEQQRQRSRKSQQIVVVPAQTNPGFKLPSEIAKEQEAAKAAKIAARKAYCEEHPVECETLAAAERARDAAESLRFGR